MSDRQASPFTLRSALGLVVFGTAVFIALLWMIGRGMAEGEANDGGAHAEGRGLNGYAALADYLERRGHPVRRSRTASGLSQPGLLVLTPPPFAKAPDIDKTVRERRSIGPTLVVTPKWSALRAGAQDTEAKAGWVRLVGPDAPRWPGFLDDVVLDLDSSGRKGDRVSWSTRGIGGTLPEPGLVMSGAGPRLVPLVTAADGRILAAYLNDGAYPGLAAMSPQAHEPAGDEVYPLVVVFEPDLLDNYGFARAPAARLGEALVRATAGEAGAVTFDLTFNGITRSANLLTLAFTPPFLAATLCLLLAAGATGWRAFLRFGPPLTPGRAIAFGKRALVANAAGLIVRSGRLHLLGAPYAEAARQRLARALALPRGADMAAIDQAARARGAAPFSQIAARLHEARSERDLVKAAQDMHALERTLTK